MTLGIGEFLFQDRFSAPEFTEFPVEGLLGTWDAIEGRNPFLCLELTEFMIEVLFSN